MLSLGTLAASGIDDKPIKVTGANAFTFYRDFEKLTKYPHYVAPLTGLLCSMPSPGALEQDLLKTGLHFQTRIHIYANDLAQPGMLNHVSSYPVGSVIVKEKIGDHDHVTGVGGMIKRAPGYDRENGDWEYFYQDKDKEFFTGKLSRCVECHAKASATDRVFSGWESHY